jgi:hypothetical protein
MMSARRVTGLMAATGAALAVVVTAPGTAAAANGKFYVGDTAVLTDPADWTCHRLRHEEGETLSNRTNRRAYVYAAPGCDDYMFTLERGETTAGTAGATWEGSVRF